MVYPYMTLQDETEVAFSGIELKNNVETLTVYFEKPVMGGFVSAECTLPGYKWNVNGLTASEISTLQAFVERNSKSFYKFAKQGGVGAASLLGKDVEVTISEPTKSIVDFV